MNKQRIFLELAIMGYLAANNLESEAYKITFSMDKSEQVLAQIQNGGEIRHKFSNNIVEIFIY